MFNNHNDQAVDTSGKTTQRNAVRGGKLTVEAHSASAISYGFRSVRVQPVFWLVSAFFYLLLAWGIGAGPNTYQILTEFNRGMVPSSWSLTIYLPFLVGFFVMPVFYSAALLQLDGYRLSLSLVWSRISYFQVLWTSALVACAKAIPLALFFVFAFAAGLSIRGGNETAGLIFIGLGFVVYSIAKFIVQVLVQLSVLLTIDGQAMGMVAVQQGFKLGRNNFILLLRFFFLAGMIELLGTVLTFGLAKLILCPAMVNATAHMYRQVLPRLQTTA